MRKETAVLTASMLVSALLCGCGPANEEISVRPVDQVMMSIPDEDETVTDTASDTGVISVSETEKEKVTESEMKFSAPAGKVTTAGAETVPANKPVNNSNSAGVQVNNGNTVNKPANNSNTTNNSANNSNSDDSNSSQNNYYQYNERGDHSPPSGNSSENQAEQQSTKQPEPTKSPETVTEAPAVEAPSAGNSISLKYADGILIVNKSYPVPDGYEPSGLVLAYGSNCEYLLPETNEAFKQLCSAAWNEGYTLWCQSGYRSYSLQTRLYNNYVSRSGKDAADTYSARPGYSEHHTGLALDLNTIDDSFADTPEGKWVADNCYRYGFIVRYPKSKESITGYKYEPWHLRYVGTDLATELYNSGLCLEEYFGLDSQYSN